MLTDKNSWHSYPDFYEKILPAYRDGRLLEIGVCAGGSLLMWKDHYPDWKVVGIDVAERPVALENHPSIITIQSNAYDLEVVRKMESFGGFDVIVDDGTHYENDLQFFCQHYTRLLNDGGVLICEDVQDAAWLPRMISMLPFGWFSAVVDLRHIKGRYDDLLLCCWKPGKRDDFKVWNYA